MIDTAEGSVWKDRLYMVLPIFLVLLVILNVISFFWNREKVNNVKDRYSLAYSSFTNELVGLRSSYLSTVSNMVVASDQKSSLSVSAVPAVATNVSESSIAPQPKCLKTAPYRYLTYNGRRVIQYYGRLYEEGSPMSLGRISRIYPDRVYFEDGSFMENTRNPDLMSSSPVPSVKSEVSNE